ncbi:hypothetical protein G6F32_016598 [Rhizopus arrhizus]|nr:hypothetical protein G6F32_016598 [Rhizopus arrhizus]
MVAEVEGRLGTGLALLLSVRPLPRRHRAHPFDHPPYLRAGVQVLRRADEQSDAAGIDLLVLPDGQQRHVDHRTCCSID